MEDNSMMSWEPHNWDAFLLNHVDWTTQDYREVLRLFSPPWAALADATVVALEARFNAYRIRHGVINGGEEEEWANPAAMEWERRAMARAGGGSGGGGGGNGQQQETDIESLLMDIDGSSPLDHGVVPGGDGNNRNNNKKTTTTTPEVSMLDAADDFYTISIGLGLLVGVEPGIADNSNSDTIVEAAKRRVAEVLQATATPSGNVRCCAVAAAPSRSGGGVPPPSSAAQRAREALGPYDQVSPLAADLPGLRHRDRMWSVAAYPDRGAHVTADALARAAQARHRQANAPPAGTGGNAASPADDRCAWAALQLTSPVMRLRDDAAFNAELASVSHALRGNGGLGLRIHPDDLPELNLGTRLVVGHTRGFTLRQLKRVVTLWALLAQRGGLASRLLLAGRGRHRSEPWPRPPPSSSASSASAAFNEDCAPVTAASRLGRLLQEEESRQGAGPESRTRLLPNPHPTDDARRARFDAQFEAHVPCWRGAPSRVVPDALVAFLRRVWQYESVSRLAAALAPAPLPLLTLIQPLTLTNLDDGGSYLRRRRRLDLGIHCRGGDTTASISTDGAGDDDDAAQQELLDLEQDLGLEREQLPAMPGGGGMIEFRLPHASLDADEVAAWAVVAGAVVARACEGGPEAYAAVVRGVIACSSSTGTGSGMSAGEVLSHLGLSPLVAARFGDVLTAGKDVLTAGGTC
ncbi:hypothetical protein GGR56DRAFT_693130 [Xylariaceae sp. FL0804]|nr:hypothetical protein GGR56DRAFT_693130 [Xylariaceae sp. FL0804]